MKVVLTPEARIELRGTPLQIQHRIATVFHRLAKWPAVSGSKPLRGTLQGSYRIRTGDYRVVFTLAADSKTSQPVVKVWKIGYRGTVYD